MTTQAATHQEVTLQVAGNEVFVRKAGSGDPLVVVHHDIGNHAWEEFHAKLAERYTVYVPDLPGYARSTRPEWARNVRDLVGLTGLIIDELELPAANILGLGFGGWLAAELATFNQQRINRLVLVNPMGILPTDGEILDQFLVSQEDYIKSGFHDQSRFVALYTEEASTDQLVEWDICREMTTRVGWKPYMFNQALPHLLLNVHTPTLVVWADGDKVVPRSTADQYVEAIPNATLEVLPNVGHLADLEAPDALSQIVGKFVG